MKKYSYCFLIFQMDGKESLFEELFFKKVLQVKKFILFFNLPNGWKRIFICRISYKNLVTFNINIIWVFYIRIFLNVFNLWFDQKFTRRKDPCDFFLISQWNPKLKMNSSINPEDNKKINPEDNMRAFHEGVSPTILMYPHFHPWRWADCWKCYCACRLGWSAWGG